jgi:tetratricopeptide (TPR) repeat protein
MAMTPLRRIFSKLCPKLRQKQTLREVLSMYDKGDFEKAHAALCKILDNQPQWSKNGGLNTLLADLELLINDDACKAIELLDRAREVGGADICYYYSVYGSAMLSIGNYKEAIKNLERSVALDPNVANLTMLAQALSKINDSREIDIWHKVLEKDPFNCLAHIYVGLEAAESGDRGKALLMAKRAEKLNPTVEDFFLIGILYHKLEEFQTAINTYLIANRLGYKDKALLYAHIAACYLSLGDENIARKYAEWAIQFDPENDYVKEVWGECEEISGE